MIKAMNERRWVCLKRGKRYSANNFCHFNGDNDKESTWRGTQVIPGTSFFQSKALLQMVEIMLKSSEGDTQVAKALPTKGGLPAYHTAVVSPAGRPCAGRLSQRLIQTLSQLFLTATMEVWK